MPPPALSSRRAMPAVGRHQLGDDGQAQAAAPERLLPWLGLPEPVEGPSPLGGRQTRTVVDDVDRRPISPRFGRQHDRRAGRGHVEGVGHVVVEHLGQAVGVGHHGGAGGHGDLEGHRPLLGERSPALGTRHEERAHVEPAAGDRLGPSVGTGQHQETVDEAGQPLGLRHGVLQVGGGVAVGVGLEVLQPQPQAGERRAELMGGVGDEGLLAPHEVLQPGRGAVEGLGQRAHLRRSAGLGDATGQVALTDVAGGLLDLPQGPGDGTGDDDADAGHHDERHQGDAGQPEPVAAAAVVDLTGRVGHPHGPPHEPARGHGHGGVHEIGAERVGAAGPGAHLAREGGLDLGPAGEGPLTGFGGFGVEEGVAVGIDHHDPAADVAGVALDLTGDVGAERARLEPLLHERGQHEGVALDARDDLLQLAALVGDAERDHEHGQHQRGDGEVAQHQPSGHRAAVTSAGWPASRPGPGSRRPARSR